METFMRVLLRQNTQVLKDQDKMAIKPMKTMKRSPLVPAAKVLLAMENLEVLKDPDKLAVKQMKTFMRIFLCLKTLEMQQNWKKVLAARKNLDSGIAALEVLQDLYIQVS